MSDSCPSLDLDLSSSTQSSLWLIFALTLTTCCIALILTYYYHTHRIFFSSSTLLMTQCILGGICITCSAAFNIPNTTNNWNSSTCTARVWLLFIGLHLSFSSLSVKLYKLHTIFTNTKITAVHVSDRRMILYCMISLIPFLIILTIWEIITPWNPPKPCDGGGGYIMGCHNTQRYIFMPLLLSMTGVVLLTLGYYIYRTYRIPYIYKDTTRILMVLINTLVTFIIGISVYSSFHESNRPIRQIKLIWSVCMLYGVISNLCILYVPMIYQYLHEPISQTLLEKEEQMLSQMSPTHPTLRNRNIPNREISQLPWSHRQPSQQPIHTITHAVEVEQGMAHGNAIDERLATLINKFDSDSTRMLTLQHEENELLMLAMRKRSEMMSLRQNCLNLRMEIEYLNHHGWNYIQHLQQHQLQTLQQLGTHNNIENLPQSLELLQQHPQLREQLQYLSRHQHTIPQQIPSTTLIQTQTTQTRESQYLQSDNGQSRNIFQHPISQTTRVLESQHTVSSPPPVTMCHVAAAVPVTSNTHPSSPISSPTPAAALAAAAAAAAAAVPAPTPTPVVVHLNDEPTQTPQFHF